MRYWHKVQHILHLCEELLPALRWNDDEVEWTAGERDMNDTQNERKDVVRSAFLRHTRLSNFGLKGDARRLGKSHRLPSMPGFVSAPTRYMI